MGLSTCITTLCRWMTPRGWAIVWRHYRVTLTKRENCVTSFKQGTVQSFAWATYLSEFPRRLSHSLTNLHESFDRRWSVSWTWSWTSLSNCWSFNLRRLDHRCLDHRWLSTLGTYQTGATLALCWWSSECVERQRTQPRFWRPAFGQPLRLETPRAIVRPSPGTRGLWLRNLKWDKTETGSE